MGDVGDTPQGLARGETPYEPLTGEGAVMVIEGDTALLADSLDTRRTRSSRSWWLL